MTQELDPFSHGILAWLEHDAAHGLFVTDAELRVRTWNRWLATASGLPADAVIGRPLVDAVPSILERGLDSHYRDALNGEPKVLSHTLHRYLIPCRRTDGTMMSQTVRITPLVRDNVITGTITVVGDVSDRVTSEKLLRAQIAAAEEARQRAEEASRGKDEFLATLSHEIRTPLSAVLGWIHLLKAREPDAATVKRGIDVIERNARSQLTLINDMLDMARISTGKMRLEIADVKLATVVSAAIDAVRPAAEAKRIRLVQDIPPALPAVSGDADRLLQVTWNLLSNAVKFTDEGGLVVIAIRSDANGTHLTVADTGRGIDAKFLPQVFDRFKQADTTAARTAGGLGLGLALVKDLVTMHGGRITAESPGVNMGATFSVHLPKRLEHEATAAPAAAVGPADLTLDGVRVLVVEDDPDAREIAERSIADAGGAPIAVSNASEALSIVSSSAMQLDALVSDIGLPGTDGYALLAEIRRIPHRHGEIPAIAVTAYASAKDASRAFEHGFVAHITKPYAPTALVAAVRQAIDRRAPTR